MRAQDSKQGRERERACACACECVSMRERISERLMYADNETPHEEDEWPKINRHQKNLKKMTFPPKEEEKAAPPSKSEPK